MRERHPNFIQKRGQNLSFLKLFFNLGSAKGNHGAKGSKSKKIFQSWRAF